MYNLIGDTVCASILLYRVERLVAEDTTIEGIYMPKGTSVAALIYAIHHDSEIWPEPSKFDPER